jgi:hypothetical protein
MLCKYHVILFNALNELWNMLTPLAQNTIMKHADATPEDAADAAATCPATDPTVQAFAINRRFHCSINQCHGCDIQLTVLPGIRNRSLYTL